MRQQTARKTKVEIKVIIGHDLWTHLINTTSSSFVVFLIPMFGLNHTWDSSSSCVSWIRQGMGTLHCFYRTIPNRIINCCSTERRSKGDWQKVIFYFQKSVRFLEPAVYCVVKKAQVRRLVNTGCFIFCGCVLFWMPGLTSTFVWQMSVDIMDIDMDNGNRSFVSAYNMKCYCF